MPAKKSKEAVALPEKSFDFSKLILGVLLVAAVIGLLVILQKYYKLKKELTVLQDPSAQQAKAKAETDELVAKVGKLIALPEGQPTIATVADSAALAKQQVFFKDAANGDKVLLYQDKAIIYRPGENRIINVGPILNIGDESSVLSLEIRNGSQKIGAANDLSDQLKAASWKVVAVGNAANADYQETVLVNLTGKDVKALEDKLKVTAVDKLPAGEASSSQDVVIILGNKK